MNNDEDRGLWLSSQMKAAGWGEGDTDAEVAGRPVPRDSAQDRYDNYCEIFEHYCIGILGAPDTTTTQLDGSILASWRLAKNNLNMLFKADGVTSYYSVDGQPTYSFPLKGLRGATAWDHVEWVQWVQSSNPPR